MEQQNIRRKICQILDISEQRYFELIYELGEEYFAWRCQGFDDVLQVFRKNRQMWNWWTRQYYMIDRYLLGETPAEQKNAERLLGGLNGMKIYRAQHIGLEYWPNKAIVRQALNDYDRIVQGLIKKEISPKK